MNKAQSSARMSHGLAAPSRRGLCRDLFDAVDDGIAVYRAVDDADDFVFVDLNPAGERFGDVQRDAVVGRRLTEVFPGVAAFGLLEALRRVHATGEPQALAPAPYQDSRVSGRWFENRVYRLDSGDVVAVYSDVTERVRAETELRNSEERYRLLSEATLDGIFDWRPVEGTLYLSPRWKAQLGFLPDELPNAFESWTDRLHPDDRERVLAHLEEFLDDPSPQWREEFRLRHREGHYTWLMARGTADIDGEGRVTRVLGVHIDVNLRHEAEQRFRDLVETTTDWVWETDAKGRYRYVGPQCSTLFGYPPDALIGKRLLDLVGVEDADRIRATVAQYRDARQGYSMLEVGCRHRDGRKICIETSGTPFFDQNGALLGYRGIDRDVTRRHAVTENLRLYERAISTTRDLMSFVDRDYTYRMVNEAYAERHGRPRESIVGLRVDELMGHDLFERVIRPELDRCFAGEDVHYQYSFDFAGKPRYMDVRYQPYRSHAGGIEGAVVSARDITDLHEVEERLRVNGERLSLALEAGCQGMYDTNLRTGEVIVNDEYAAMLGFDPATFAETHERWLARIHPDDSDRVQRHLDDYLAGRVGDYRIEFRQHTADGDWKWLLSVGRLVERDSDGRPLRLIGTHTDISLLKDAQARVRQAAQVFSSTVEGVTITDLEGTILDVNDAFCRITGFSRDEALGRNPRILQSGRHDAAYYKAMWQSLVRKGYWRGEIWNRRKDGLVYPATLTISQVRDDSGTPTGYVAVFADITASKQTEERLQHLAHHDPLTELPNRLLFSARLEQGVKHAARLRQRMALLFVDLDRFKHVNDSLGHAAGDSLLQQLAQRLRGVVRADDTVARISGDEFVVLLDNVESADNVTVVVRKIMSTFDEPFVVERHEVSLTCSIGISLYPDDGDEAGILLRNADAAMYRAKDGGRNTYQFYAAEMTTAAFEHVFLENALRGAIRQRQFELLYQPQFDLGDGSLVGFEALVRWHHPQQGTVLPGRFIPIAEQTGLIREIGAWVLDEACRQARSWLDAGLCFGRIAVNVSGSEIQHEDYAALVAQALDRHQLAARYLELEVTESFVMAHTDEGLRQLAALNDIGVTIAIDDFGTGYSSLAYLKSLPVDTLKVDRSFVRDIPADGDDMAIAEAIIALGRALNLNIIAEGIETAEQANFLRRRGCRQGQGFFLTEPLAGTAATARLEKP
jgi:diguanylate cyclase (GGDEF)-like protein/PAS domain S-box-containing protein